MFIPQAKSDDPIPRMAGIVDDDGNFEMSTSVGAGTLPGIKPGKYFVTVTWNEKVDPTDKDSDDGPDLVPSHYSSYQSSPLRAEVSAGGIELKPFVLIDQTSSE
jgi:hypothetical protein